MAINNNGVSINFIIIILFFLNEKTERETEVYTHI